MQGFAWTASYLEHRVDDAAWFCVLVFEGRRLVGVGTFIHGQERSFGIPTRFVSTPRDDHTFGVNLLVAPGRAERVVAAILQAASAHAGQWHYLKLMRVPEGSEVRRAIAGQGWRWPETAQLYGVGAYLPTRGDFARYRGGLSRNFRNNLNKAGNKLRKLADVRFSFVTGSDARPELLERLAKVEAASWKGEQGSAIRNDDALIRFYRSLCERLANAGWLEWHFLESDGEVLAGNLAVRFGTMLLVWKLGYDEAHRRLSPGSLLFEKLIERAFADDSISEINMTTDQPWYDNWGMAKRRYLDIKLHRLGARPLLTSYLPERARDVLRDVKPARDLLRRLRPR